MGAQGSGLNDTEGSLSTMIRVCMISYSQYHDSRVLRYATSLQCRGDRVDMICLGKPGDQRIESIREGLTIYRLQARRFDERSVFSYLRKWLLFFTRAAFTLTFLHLHHRYDIIHYHNIPNFGVFCSIIPSLTGAKIILDIHDIVPEYFMRKFKTGPSHPLVRLLKFIERAACVYADHVITVTPIWFRKLTSRSVSPSKCTIIMNLPDPELFQRNHRRRSDQQPFTLLYPGNLGEHFGVDTAIRAMQIVHRSVPDALLRIVGSGQEESRLVELRDMLGLQSIVSFSGKRVPLQQIPRLMESADVGIVPKRGGIFSDEALSTKLLEFAMMGVPVIVSRTSASEMLFDESMVRFFVPDDAADLAEAILDLYQSPAKRKRLGEKARRITEKVNWSEMKARYFRLIDQMVLRTGEQNGVVTARTVMADQ